MLGVVNGFCRYFSEMIGIAGIQQSGALPYQRRDDSIWVLLVQSSTSKHWIFPKGNLEPGLSSSESAYFEAFEEAGVVGTIGTRSIGSYKYRKKPEKGGELCRVKLYPLQVTQVLEFYPERDIRPRAWMTVQDALEALQDPKLKFILAEFASRA